MNPLLVTFVATEAAGIEGGGRAARATRRIEPSPAVQKRYWPSEARPKGPLASKALTTTTGVPPSIGTRVIVPPVAVRDVAIAQYTKELTWTKQRTTGSLTPLIRARGTVPGGFILFKYFGAPATRACSVQKIYPLAGDVVGVVSAHGELIPVTGSRTLPPRNPIRAIACRFKSDQFK